MRVRGGHAAFRRVAQTLQEKPKLRLVRAQDRSALRR